ncbi:hypothetical protein Salat_0543400 [Sesamum alatum]|uniref:Leucine-rich repeat-containing N-terminal plant-type domain-containing protein n=1 Tax=Sesamum alatum TaxID=300844 RepID=A0AAE1YPK1_9LAMI|nr:hypothetical protein Salat_0543400 [Sesamum alatum]
MKLSLHRMAISMQLSFSLCSLMTFLLLSLTENPLLADSKTLESDIQVLRSIRQSINPHTITSSSFLHSWNFAVDPCDAPGPHFLGILCDIPDNNSSSRITAINLQADGLEGFLPPGLGNLTELTLLNLGKNKFHGPIPDSIVNMRKITRLLLSDNSLSGSIPHGFRGLKRLEIIDLSHNRLSGSIPAAISSIRSLIHLRLSSNKISGRIPDLTGLWQLNTLDLSSNQLVGNIPEFPNSLITLSLRDNLLSGHISSLNGLRHLRALDLSHNRFSGPINQAIFALPEIRNVNVSANLFTRIDVMRMSTRRRPSQLRAIEAQSNRISGRLPINLITYQNLNSVNLGHNLFHGRIPVEYGERVSKGFWRSLFLDYNMLQGNVPSGFSHGSSKGSLAHNCLNCRRGIPMCRGRQRSPTDCVKALW